MELVKANRGRMEVGVFSDFEKRTSHEKAVQMSLNEDRPEQESSPARQGEDDTK